MRILNVYRRVIAMLAADKRLAVVLGLANAALAGLQFLDPYLFGRVIGLLTLSDTISHDDLWTRAVWLIGIWIGVAALAIGGNIITVVQAERMAHRNRLKVMSRFFTHVLSLPLSFHGEAHSGRLMKVMLGGADSMFSVWLTFFREQLATYVALVVLLPLTLLLNWQLGLVLIVLVVLFCTVTVLVINKTQEGQARAEQFQSSLASTAQDALANVMVVQSFTRLAAETRHFSKIADDVIAHQFPVLNWWALVNVLTRGASTIAVIVIVLIGTLLHVAGQATVTEIVTFMGFANLLISRLESAMQFASRLFLQLPGLEEHFAVLDAKTSVPEQPDSVELDAPRGEVAFEAVSFAYPGGPAILQNVSFVAQPGSVVALVGSTGAGKSTAMNLLQRLWDPTAGRVAIDGQDIRHVTLESLRRTIGVVFQESLLFNRSIRENLRIGRPEPPMPRWSRPAAWRTRTTSSSASRRATTRWWANAAPPCRAGSASAWPSRGRC